MKREDREGAYVDFVVARQTQLRRIAYSLCGDWHQADDLLQIALTKLYVAWPRIRRDGREEAYARQIIVRTSIDEHRRSRNRERPGLEGLDAAAEPIGSPEDRAEVIAALQTLPEMQRKVVVLRHWLGLSVAETAGELAISEGTVKSHSSRGLEKLRLEVTRSG